MENVEQVLVPSAVGKKAPAVSGGKKKKGGSSGAKMTYASMITMSIIEMKEKKGSSRQAILKHIASTYKVMLVLYRRMVN